MAINWVRINIILLLNTKLVQIQSRVFPCLHLTSSVEYKFWISYWLVGLLLVKLMLYDTILYNFV